MQITPQEKKLIRVLRLAGTDLPFIMIHLANLYARQAHLDEQAQRVNTMEMKRRANLYYAAYSEMTQINTSLRNKQHLFLIK